jgi:Flp pilus assembly pilin Flp
MQRKNLMFWHMSLVEDEGQALTEYALILMLVALVTVSALTGLGTTVAQLLTDMANGL